VIQQPPNTPFTLGPLEADTACLLIHGFSGNPAELRGLGEALAVQGVRVSAILLPGHTGNPEELIGTSRKEWLACAEEGLAQLAAYPRVFLAGLSMGGVLSLLLAAHHPTRISGTIVMSTPTRFAGGWQIKVLPLARHVVKWFYPLSILDFNDPRVQARILQQARLRDPAISIDFSDHSVVARLKRMIRIPLAAIDELVRLTNAQRSQLKDVRSPVLIIQSKSDQTVNPACAEELYRLATNSESRALHWLEVSDHVITVGPEKEEVFQLVGSFITATGRTGAQSEAPG
jgi:carboxylesterase